MSTLPLQSLVSLCRWKLPLVVERLSLASCIYVQVKSGQVFWMVLPVKGRGTSQSRIVLAAWSDAGWMPYGDRTVLDPVHHRGSWASSPHLPSSSPNQSTYCSRSGTDEHQSVGWWSSVGVHGLQGGVNVDKDDDYQVENGPNDAQHGQDALLLALLVLDSLFLITVESVYHFLWKSLQFSSQTNLEQADKRKKRKNTIHVSCRNSLIFSLWRLVFAQCMVDSDNGNTTKIKVIWWWDGQCRKKHVIKKQLTEWFFFLSADLRKHCVLNELYSTKSCQLTVVFSATNATLSGLRWPNLL